MIYSETDIKNLKEENMIFKKEILLLKEELLEFKKKTDKKIKKLKLSENLNEKEKKKPKKLENKSNAEWESIKPIDLGNFACTSTDCQFKEIPKDIPDEAKELLILYHIRCGSEKEGFFNINIWTENPKGKKFVKIKRGYRYPQSAISFDSENLWFPFFKTNRKLYFQTDQIITTNCHCFGFWIIGYRL
jgi:hypothetical protein